MATITSLGVGTGLDLENIVSSLMEIERQPLARLQSKESIINAQISAYGAFKSKLADFQSAMEALGSASAFKQFQATSQDEELFSASADSDAVAGEYSINVVALAQRDKLASAAFSDTDSIGQGTLSISVGAESFDVVIDSTNDSLAGIRNAINNASANTGVSASIITDDAGSRLILTSDDTGTENALSISVSDDSDGNNSDSSGLSAFVNANMTTVTSATDAVVEIDNFTVTSSSNTISGAIEGVSITAKAMGSSTLSITRDDEAILESVKEFASAYNSLMTEIKSQRSGQLEADSTLLTIERQIRDVFNSGSAISGSSFRYLVEAGVSLDKNGEMKVDEEQVTSLLDSDFSSFVNLFSAEGEGYANRLDSLADGWLQTDGLIDSREVGLNARLDTIDRQRDRMEARLATTEERIRAQYAAMDTLVSSLNSQGNYLLSQLSALSQN
jgi:flagellar hook-associated protein 2